MHAIHTPCKICVVADCLDILSYKLTFKGAGRQLEKYGKYTRFTNTKRHRRILRVRGSYKELKKPSSTLKAESEDFCSKRIVTLCVSPLDLDNSFEETSKIKSSEVIQVEVAMNHFFCLSILPGHSIRLKLM